MRKIKFNSKTNNMCFTWQCSFVKHKLIIDFSKRFKIHHVRCMQYKRYPPVWFKFRITAIIKFYQFFKIFKWFFWNIIYSSKNSQNFLIYLNFFIYKKYLCSCRTSNASYTSIFTSVYSALHLLKSTLIHHKWQKAIRRFL